MNKRLFITLLAVLVAAPIAGQIATAQNRADEGWYLRPRLGMSYYVGENQSSPFGEDLFEGGFPYYAGLEIGRRFTPTYQAGLSLSLYKTPGINEFLDEVTPIKVEDIVGPGAGASNTLFGVHLIGRKYFGVGKVAPYASGGLGIVGSKGWTLFGDDQSLDPCYSDVTKCVDDGDSDRSAQFQATPSFQLSFGLDFTLSRLAKIFVETGLNATSEIADIDGFGDQPGWARFDLLGWNAMGLKLDLKSFTPVQVTDLICPAGEITTGEPTTFTASVNPDATQPVMTSWNFGDGSTASGLSATHTFSRAGSYDVTFTATNGNGKSTSNMVCAVSVKDSCVKADIVSMTASTMSPDTRTAITFSSNVRGTDPKQYHWDFGDGQMAMSASGTHTYSQPGTYTVKLVVTNCGGSVEKTMTITVAPYEAAICREITEMNPVFFGVNSSTLTPEAREKLQENLAILKECPNLNARLEGWAAPGERRPDQLSVDRAKAVEQFYVDNGIALSRLVTVGMGRVQGMTSKKEGASGYRRVDTIPVRN